MRAGLLGTAKLPAAVKPTEVKTHKGTTFTVIDNSGLIALANASL